MTKEEVLALAPGRELNVLVAVKALGWIPWEETRGEYTHIIFQKPGNRSINWERENKRYRRKQIDISEIDFHNKIVHGLIDFSGDISAAWEVVDHLKKSHTIFHLARKWRTWEATFVPFAKIDGPHAFECDTAPEAICKAALLAVMEL